MPDLKFLYNQLFVSLPTPTGSYAGQTIIVTGSNVGLGKEAARHFARLGASTVILAVRSLEKGYEAKADIESSTGCKPGALQVWELDMASYASVKAFAKRVADDLARVDIMIENAGIATPNFQVAEGNESTITVNVVSTFLLAALLLPKLRRTADEFGIRPTLTIVASEVHSWAAFKERKAPEGKIFDLLNDKENWEKNGEDRYFLSKLLEILAIQAIADRNGSGTPQVTVNCVNPGFCHSSLLREADTWVVGLQKRLVARTTEEGSRTLVHAGSQGVDSHLKYLSNCSITSTSGLAASKGSNELQERVWKELSQKLEDIQPGATQSFNLG